MPKLLLKNRGAELSKLEVVANRGALEVPLRAVVERAVTPVLAPEDCVSVGKALAALVVKESTSTAAVLEAIILKLPMLQMLSSMWLKLPVRPFSARVSTFGTYYGLWSGTTGKVDGSSSP